MCDVLLPSSNKALAGGQVAPREVKAVLPLTLRLHECKLEQVCK